jgi:hypothetical protein
MSFVAVAVGAVGEGIAANLLAGAMMGATATVAGNVIGGRDPFDNIGKGIVMGGLTAGLTPGVAQAFEIGMPAAAGITSFGLNTLATGDLGKGLAAGIGAYGMYGLSENMVTAGGNALVADANLLAAQQAAELSGLESMSNAFGEAGANVGADAIGQATTGTTANPNSFDKLSRGFDAAKANPGTFFKDNAKNLMYAAGPILADAAVKSNMPTTTTRPGAMRRFSYDPYGQIYTPIGNYEVPVKAAGGGLMGMDDGGYNPGQLDFMQRSEPVVRMAVGGDAGAAAGATTPAITSVEDLYTQILGREGEKAGLDFWRQGFGDTIDANEIASFRNAAQAEIAKRTPVEQQILAPNLVNTTGAAAPAPATVSSLYTDILGRSGEQTGVDYWQNQFGSTIDANELAQFKTAAQAEIDARNAGATTGLNNLAAANNITNVTTGATGAATSLADAQSMVNNMYRNVLGRDADPEGLRFWSGAIASGRSPESIYQDFLTSARANTELVTADQIKNRTFAEATTPFKGYTSADTTNIVDEWVRNTLGREPTAADKAQQWYKDAYTSMSTQGQAKGLYDQFLGYAKTESPKVIADRIKEIDAELRAKGLTDADLLLQTGKTKQQLASEGIDLSRNLIGASQLSPLGARADLNLKAKLATLTPITNTNDGSVVARTVTNPYGNATNPGDLTYNRDGSTTVTPNIPYRPYGGFPGMASVRDAYTQGGGRLGYIPDTPKTIEEFNERYNTLTGGSAQAMDYLTGKTKYSATPSTETGEVMKPYAESVLGRPLDVSTKRVLFDPKTKTYKNNPDYIPVSYTAEGKKVYGLSGRDINSYIDTLKTGNSVPGQIAGQVAASQAVPKWMKDNNVTYAQLAEALGISVAEAKKRYPETAAAATASETPSKEGGLMKLAGGGMAGQFDLGGYSDGGRLLRGPGDGVSDSIPATIGNKRPARLADGEFVVPARIVSELGNGSTEAGARKLYAMMDRVQRARRGTVGKGRVAKNSRADKHLPA